MILLTRMSCMLNLIKTVYEQTRPEGSLYSSMNTHAPLLDVVHEDTSLDILRG